MKYFFINRILGIFFSIPDWVLNLFFREKNPCIRNNYLDQQTKIFLSLMDASGDKLDVENFNSLERIRINNARLSLNINKKPSQKISFNDRSLNEDETIILREYRPLKIQSDKTILFFHGGGYALGSIETHHNFVASMSIYLGVKIHSLEYSLSPENKFPKALEDAKKAYLEIIKNYDNSKIILCGDSAGAHLAASLTYDLCESEIPSPFAQILIYPMICPSLDFESMELYKEDFLLTKSSMVWFWNQLRSSQKDNKDPRFDLLKQDKMNLSVTKTLVVTAGFDPLYDEGVAYIKLLKKNGNEVQRLDFKDLIHGFINLTNIRRANSATIKIFETINEYLD